MRRSDMRILAWTTTAAVLLGLWNSESAAEIYACEGDDSVMSYQDQPCSVPAPEDADGEAKADPSAEADPKSPQAVAELPTTVVPKDAELVAACKKRYRDAIDRLYAELASGDAPDELEEYREQARALSQQLIRCEHGGTNSTSGDR